MLSMTVSEFWWRAYPGAVVGIMSLTHAANHKKSAALQDETKKLENELHSQILSKADLLADGVIQAYRAYYKIFKKSYHVLFQLESIALKGKTISGPSPLVEAMFTAELKNRLLTAGHDLQSVEQPIRLDISGGIEEYTLLNGSEQALKPGDMIMTDEQGVISSVIYGPDNRTPITQATTQPLFVVYAPPGIGPNRVIQHLEDIKAFVALFSPDVELNSLETFTAQ